MERILRLLFSSIICVAANSLQSMNNLKKEVCEKHYKRVMELIEQCKKQDRCEHGGLTVEEEIERRMPKLKPFDPSTLSKEKRKKSTRHSGELPN